MCAKDPMQADGIVRLSKVEVYPELHMVKSLELLDQKPLNAANRLENFME